LDDAVNEADTAATAGWWTDGMGDTLLPLPEGMAVRRVEKQARHRARIELAIPCGGNHGHQAAWSAFVFLPDL
jgi:hypothetical protein